jgi:hypothetical protein
MRIIAGLLVALGAIHSFGQATNTNNITGEWELNGNLTSTVGSALQFRGSPTHSFETSTIAGQSAQVLRLPSLSPDQGLIMPHGAVPNGGGANVNEYTLIMDVMWPGESDETWRALFQSDTNNLEDAILFVNPANALGINNVYEGELPANTWHRIAMVYSLADGTLTLTKYINGDTNGFSQILGNNAVDSIFSLRPSALLFSDDDGETGTVLVNSIQFRSVAMSAEEIGALGTATAGGLSGGGGGGVGDVRIERIEKIGSEVVLTVSGDGSLQLQKTTSLGTPSWQNIGSPAATNTFRVPATDPEAFFRFERR